MVMRENRKSTLKKAANIIGRIVTLFSVVFVIVAVYRLGFDFSAVKNVTAFILLTVVGSIIISITVFLLGIAWGEWLNFFSKKKNPMKDIVSVYAKANIGKYLPGNVMHYVERNMFAGNLGISQRKVALSSILEIVCQAGIAFVLAVCFSKNQLSDALANLGINKFSIYVLVGVIVFVVIFISVVYCFRNKIKDLFASYTVRGFLVTVAKNIIIYATVLILGGMILIALYIFMGGKLEFQSAIKILTGYIIAWILGFVVPGAPGGIGVREFVLALLLGNLVGNELILTLSIMHRLITILGDFLAYVLRIWIMKVGGRNK